MEAEAQAKIVTIPAEKATQDLLAKALAEFAVITVVPDAGLAEEVEKLGPDLILLDAALPSQDGYSICKQLHAHRRTREVPVAYITRTSAEVSAFGANTDRILAADDPEALSRQVSRLIDEHRARALLRQAVAQWEARHSNELTMHELDVLESGGFARDTRPTPEPIIDTVSEYEALLAQGLDVSSAARHLDVTQGRIRQRLTAQPPELYGVRRGKAWVLPAFQFTSAGLVPHIDQVIARLPPGMNPVAVARFFTLPSAELSEGDSPTSPVNWLSRGEDWEVVAELAENAGGLA